MTVENWIELLVPIIISPYNRNSGCGGIRRIDILFC